MEDLDFVKNQDWPNWPLLPMKNKNEFGTLVASPNNNTFFFFDGISIWDSPDDFKKTTPNLLDIDQIKIMLEKGWRVD